MASFVQAAPYGLYKSNGDTHGKVFWVPSSMKGGHNGNSTLSPTTVVFKERVPKIENNTPKDSTIVFRVINKQPTYIPNKRHTLLVEINNFGEALLIPQLNLQLPEDWQLISLDNIKVIKKNEKKRVSFSFFIPSDASAGEAIANFTLKNNIGVPLESMEIPLEITTSEAPKEQVLRTEGNSSDGRELLFKIINKKSTYIPNKRHTLLVEINNLGEALLIPQLHLQLPEDWQLISIDNIKVIKKNEKKRVSFSFFIPSNVPAKEDIVNLTLKSNIGVPLESIKIPLVIAPTEKAFKNKDTLSPITTTVAPKEQVLRPEGNSSDGRELLFKIIDKKSTYIPNKRHTLLVEINNFGEALLIPQLDLQLPKDWQLLSIDNIKVIKKNEKKRVSFSFFIPSNASAGEAIAIFTLKNNIGVPLESMKIPLEISAPIPSLSPEPSMGVSMEQAPKTENNSAVDSEIVFRLVNKQPEYTTSKRHTLLVEINNRGNELVTPTLSMALPDRWQLVSINNINTIKKNEKKLVFISFFIPSNAPAGEAIANLTLKNNSGNPLKSVKIPLEVAPNYDLEVFNVGFPESVEAGETIKMTYAVKNIGNIDQEILLTSKNEIKGPLRMVLVPDTTVIIPLHQNTDKKINAIRTVYTKLEVYGVQSNNTYSAVKNVEVFPLKITKEDPFFRFPIKTAIFYNSYTNKEEHYSTMSLEISGSGYLDLAKNHHLDFTFRGPRQEKIRRFGNTDYYGLTYKYKQDTKVFLGDHSHSFNRLGLNGKYGMGFVFDQQWEKWSLSAFYTKPRLNSFDTDALSGIKTSFFWNEFTTSGIALQRTIRSEIDLSSPDKTSVREKGFVLTFDMEYDKNNTNIALESSVSTTNRFMDVANYFNVGQRIGRFSYTGNITRTGMHYFGTMNNSTRYYNSLSYDSQNWIFRIGHGLSQVNQKLDPLYYASEPYYENYFADVRYRRNKRHQINLGVSSRLKEDRLEPKNYHYREHGLNYGYTYTHQTFNANVGGTLGRTQNLLSEDTDYRTTYNHNVGLGLRMFHHFGLRGKLSHNYSNRYGYDNTTNNYYRYSLGVNGKIGRRVNFSANFNSGFSPEETYLKRDYINLSLMAHLHKNHQIEILTNYFENPGIVGNAEILAYAKYSLTLGAPLKRVLQQGGITGTITASTPAISTRGIKIIATGKSLLTDKNGHFEINNLPLGKNFIVVDQSTLPQNVITLSKNPHEVFIEKSKKIHLNIQLIQSASIRGLLYLPPSEGTASDFVLNGYVKLENDQQTLYTETDKNGNFEFHRLTPGTYTVSLLRLKERDNEFSSNRSIQVTLAEGETLDAKIDLNLKERKVKFQNKKFNLKRQ
ncbi:Uncharacterized membrane protein [Arenibacter nanhaiticus]|uniref:Uncharacterized membrane protein n=1 Tax=Arenibacter nanhaiticus TaxID=558155 RepID=A0A1M6MLY4_9FLAO|nr:hypothetical protein [Arenibacter nanhaiticus]SHJ84459.1 Uncharacterized membrane protein [Arenibacter nanhaiticus]